MPFKKINPKKIIHEKIIHNPEYKAAYNEVETEYRIIEMAKQTRKRKGLTQVELAKKVGVSQQAISRFEREMHMPTLENLLKILYGLDLTLSVHHQKKDGAVEAEKIAKA